MDEGLWTKAGAALSALVLFSYWYAEVLAPKLRRKKRLKALTTPADAFFLITSTKHRKIDFAVQDSEEHLVKELVLPSHAESKIEILLRPRVFFRTSEISFGCHGNREMGDKPCAIEYFNPFIVKGIGRSAIPDTDPGHIIDHNDYYHLVRDMHWSVGTDRIVGFKVLTKGRGVHKAEVVFGGEEVEGQSELTIRVEDEPKTFMKCVSASRGHGDCLISPTARTTP